MAYQYAFINAGVDEPKRILPGETYEGYRNRDSNFQQFMNSEGYTSGVYRWDDFVNLDLKQDITNEVRVSVNGPSNFGLIPAVGPIFMQREDTFYIIVTDGIIYIIVYDVWLFPVIPAWIAWLSNNEAKISVATTRKEPDANLGLWQMDIPDITSGAQATTYGGNVYTRGYDCRLRRIW